MDVSELPQDLPIIDRLPPPRQAPRSLPGLIERFLSVEELDEPFEVWS